MSLTQRGHEDSHWRTQNGDSHTGSGGFGSKLDGYGFRGEKRELPMYKDKPYNYAGSRRNVSFYRRRRVLVGAILGIVALAYWSGIFSSSTIADKPKSKSRSKSSWSWLGKQEAAFDWDERREKVKDAFMLSWDGYERYAWGTLDSFSVACTYLLFSEDSDSPSTNINDENQSDSLQGMTNTILYQRLAGRWTRTVRAWAG